MMKPRAHFDAVAIYGVGLLGGAVGAAARKKGLAKKVIGLGRNAGRLEKAAAAGCLDEFTTELDEAASDCDLFILALPVSAIIEEIPRVAASVKKGCVVTDVGSVKKGVCEAGEKTGVGGPLFVGSHVMAGSEKSGFENADLVDFQGAAAFVALTPRTDRDAAARVALFWKALGMTPVFIDPERHDECVARLSHLPHLAAAALANVAARSNDDLNFVKAISGTGFRDAARLAAGDPGMWLDICRENRDHISRMLGECAEELESLKNALDENDDAALRALLEKARSFRLNFD